MNKEILIMSSNKVKVTIEMTTEQRKDFLKVLDEYCLTGNTDRGRMCQLWSAHMNDEITKRQLLGY